MLAKYYEAFGYIRIGQLKAKFETDDLLSLIAELKAFRLDRALTQEAPND